MWFRISQPDMLYLWIPGCEWVSLLLFCTAGWTSCSAFASLFSSSSTPASAYTITGSLRAVWQWKVMSLLTTLCEAMARSREECFQKYIVLTQAVRLFTSVFSYLQQWILIQQQFVSWFVFWKWNWKPVLTGGKWSLLALCGFSWLTPVKQHWINVSISN